ncbi:MAG: hypothetical protein GF401_03615 [Chitinivibrionales bacterium]|nr:hypothetical protein [Chitinivibrionales bacterium]
MQISFFHPLFLWGLAFLSVPILIHLLNRKRTVRLDFSSLRFFRQTAVKTSKRRQIQRLLLLITRLLIILLIILIFSKPYNNTSPFTILNNPDAAVYCWIDPTISMDYRDGKQALWERGLTIIDSLARQLPATARCYTYDHNREEFVVHTRQKEPTERFTRHGPSDFSSMTTSFMEQSKKKKSIPLLVLISDFQYPRDSSFKRIPDQVTRFLGSDKEKIPPTLCVMLGDPKAWNYSIMEAGISPENPSSLKALLRTERKKVEEEEITVIAGNTRIGHELVSVPPDDTLGIQMNIGTNRYSTAGRLELAAKDPFVHDNTAWFTLTEDQHYRALIVGDYQQSYPLAAALKALKESRWDPVITMDPQEVTYEDLDSADLILLSGIREPSRALQSLITAKSFGRKAILFSPTTDSLFRNWNRIVFNHLHTSCRLKSTEKGFFPVLPDTLSITWKGFPKIRETDIAVYRYWQDIPGNAMLRLNNNDPLASKTVDSLGHNWIVLATNLGITEANNICETGFFVPFLDRLARAALAGIQKDTHNWKAGIHRRNPYYGYSSSAKIFDSNDALVGRWDNQPEVVLRTPGIYKVVPDNGGTYRLAVNVDPAETEFTYRKPSIPESKKNEVRILNGKQVAAFVKNTRRNIISYILWIILAVLVLGEILLWRKP